jgi:hypothetical protein
MHANDRMRFFELLDHTCESINMREPMTGGAKAIIFDDLAAFPFEVVKLALQAHRKDPQRGQWQPNTAHIEWQIRRRMPVQWVAADEAWGLIPKWQAPGKLATPSGAVDDWRAAGWPLCLMNQVTAEAIKAAAPMMERKRPDEVSARMAFKGAYDRGVEREKLAGRAPMWFISGDVGDEGRREDLQQEAARLGYLTVQGLPFAPPAAAPQLGHTTTADRAKFKEALAGLKMKSLPSPGAEE